VCQHREHAAIDLAAARGVSISALARRYGVSTDSLYRHRASHIPPQLRAKLLTGPGVDIDLDKLRETESQSLLANLVALRGRLFALLDAAEESGAWQAMTSAAAQLHRNMELVARLVGELGVGTTINNVLVMPQYIELRHTVIRALAAHPEARASVAAALRELESKAAAAIAADGRRLAS